jgi:hypothetical protein
MTTDRDFDRIAKAFMADGPRELSVRVLDAVVDDIHVTRQRRAPRVPWRFPIMLSPVRVAVAAVFGAFAIGGAFAILGIPGLTDVGGPSPTPTSSAAVPPSTAALVVPPLDKPFTSTRHGYSVVVPSSWPAQRASQRWAEGATPTWGDPTLDTIWSEDSSNVRFVAASQKLGAGQTPEAWLTAYCRARDSSAASCGPSITIGGQAGYLARDGVIATSTALLPGRGAVFDAAVVVGGRGYAFTMDGGLDRGYFQAFLDTVTFDPAAADDASTFVSWGNDYIIVKPDTWKVVATKPWIVGMPRGDGRPVYDEFAITGTDSTIRAGLLERGTSVADWAKATLPAGCSVGDPSTWKLTPTGSEMRYVAACDGVVALGSTGPYTIVFSLDHATQDATQHMTVSEFLAALSTVKFGPTAGGG